MSQPEEATLSTCDTHIEFGFCTCSPKCRAAAAPELEPEALRQVVPTDADLEVAYDCLRKVPWDVAPVQHLGRIIARYRLQLEAAR